MTEALQIHPARREDSAILFQWRNDPHSRTMFRKSTEVTWEEHARWFESLLGDPNRLLYIGYLNTGDRVGACRFDIDSVGQAAEVSINLSPSMRGKGLSTNLLNLSLKEFREKVGLTILIRATIRRENAASVRCFVKSGFSFESEISDFYHYVLRA